MDVNCTGENREVGVHLASRLSLSRFLRKMLRVSRPLTSWRRDSGIT